ncbi:MAG TPA: hypothetical protein VIR03_00135 [Candidatus Saccharimonadales bacterium]
MRHSRRATRYVAAGLSLGLSVAALNGVGNEALGKQPTKAEHIEPAEQAREASITMARRYGTCAVTSVTDYHELQAQHGPGADGKLRDRVAVTVHLEKSLKAKKVEAQYAHDASVHWRPADVIFRKRNLANPSESRLGARTALPATEQFASYARQQPLDMKTTVFPSAADIGQTVDVVVMTDGASEVENQKTEAFGGAYCGTIVAKMIDGRPTWVSDPHAMRSGDFLQVRTCVSAIDPAQPRVLTNVCTRVDS